MAYFPADMPGVEPDFDDREFWAFCGQRSLRFQACAKCGTLRHPPGPLCPKCLSSEVEWKEAHGEAVLYSFTAVHHASHAVVAANLPYVVGLVEFPAMSGVRLVSNVTDIEPGRVRIGMPLGLWWDDIGQGQFVPRFRPK
jgi:uncharacterized OB-fold protein